MKKTFQFVFVLLIFCAGKLCFNLSQYPIFLINIFKIAAQVHSDERIVGGQPIDISEIPYQASVLYLNYHLCGGSILSPKWVVSASHCGRVVHIF
jgi:secreted trypsin-like serine protease